jgi:hypothetical protein
VLANLFASAARFTLVNVFGGVLQLTFFSAHRHHPIRTIVRQASSLDSARCWLGRRRSPTNRFIVAAALLPMPLAPDPLLPLFA